MRSLEYLLHAKASNYKNCSEFNANLAIELILTAYMIHGSVNCTVSVHLKIKAPSQSSVASKPYYCRVKMSLHIHQPLALDPMLLHYFCRQLAWDMRVIRI